jgi:mRNA interferase HicA
VKRRDLLRYLSSYGCEQLREGGNHSWWWNPSRNLRSSIPRHTEIKELGTPEKARSAAAQLVSAIKTR